MSQTRVQTLTQVRSRTAGYHHLPKQPRSWARQYLPGYTGHVPNKNELFGKTAGSIAFASTLTSAKLVASRRTSADLHSRKVWLTDAVGYQLLPR